MLELEKSLLEFFGQIGPEGVMALQGVALLMLILLVVKIFRRKAVEQVDLESGSMPRGRVAPKPAPVVNQEPLAKAGESVVSAVREAKVEPGKPSPQTAIEDAIPEDSVLHRHYLANREAEHLALTEPYPTDSVLHRHYDAIHCYHAEKPAAPATAAVVAVKATAGSSAGCKASLPQDSVLRRHYLAQLKAEVEAGLPPAPSDSVLRRHHQALVAAEINKRLAALAS